MNKSVTSYKNEPHDTPEQLEELLENELSYINNIALIYVASSMNTLFIKYKQRSKLAALTKLQIDILKEYGYEFSHVNFAAKSAYFKRSD